MKTEESLKNLELELLTFECRQNSKRIDELLADDFFECGKHGDRYGKKEVLEALSEESEDKRFETSDMTVHVLAPDIVQVRYVCVIQNPGEQPTTSFRSSLWRKTESGWQMFFHQGTLLV